MNKNPWFRMYTEAVDDEKLRLLAFEDRWHYVGILCLKGQGMLDDNSDQQLRLRKVAVKLGVQLRELDEIARRLSDVGLIDQSTLQPIQWDKRQYKSDSSAERVQRHRQNQKPADVKRSCNVTVTPPETETETETETEQENKKGKTGKRFVPPTTDEVYEYCQKRSNAVQADRFVNFYEAKGWMVGKNKMRDWKAAVRTWEASDKDSQPKARRRQWL